jgi:hypothetical protein
MERILDIQKLAPIFPTNCRVPCMLSREYGRERLGGSSVVKKIVTPFGAAVYPLQHVSFEIALT